MKPLLTALMLGKCSPIFVFGASQHAGVAIGSLHEPVIVPASVVEVLCAVALSWGAAAVLKQSLKARRAAFIGTLVAIIGVAIGMVSLAVGAGPRTASNQATDHLIALHLTPLQTIATSPTPGPIAPTPDPDTPEAP
jgi:hypothetical protein